MELETNKTLVHKWIDAWITNDRDVLDEIFARDYTVNGALVGSAGVKQAVQFLHSVLSCITAELQEIVAEADKVVIRWTIRGQQTGNFMGIPPTGKALEFTGINIYQIVDGKIQVNHEQTNIGDVLQKLKAHDATDEQ